MANKKPITQAEKTASAAKSKGKAAKNSKESKNESSKNEQLSNNGLPIRLVSSLVLLALAIFFVFILFGSDGALITLFESVILGLIGRTSLVVSIPVLLYLFIIHAFSGRRPIKFRTVCLLIFVFLCGCLSHLNDVPSSLPNLFTLVSGLY